MLTENIFLRKFFIASNWSIFTVSAIYGDPTLGANLKFVILRMIFYEDDSINQILEDNSTVSLENVNVWNKNILTNLPVDERHDVAVWITRLNIGGPGGYAPVSGVCDPERSCSLNRDEGLSSAFILAHELGHILGKILLLSKCPQPN